MKRSRRKTWKGPHRGGEELRSGGLSMDEARSDRDPGYGRGFSIRSTSRYGSERCCAWDRPRGDQMASWRCGSCRVHLRGRAQGKEGKCQEQTNP